MRTLNYTVRFTTPAFLGGADQSGQWRTPPFKALLRQWWRVAAAKDYGYDVGPIRTAEAALFGAARDEDGGSQKSRVRIRLDGWREGSLKKTQWPGRNEARLVHPEVTNRDGKPMKVGAELYLGYGPLAYDRAARSTVLKANAAIQAGESAELKLAWPNDTEPLENALLLAHWLGTIGGRSRNGWGSLTLYPKGNGGGEFGAVGQNDSLLQNVSLPLAECLKHDWPHAIGRDDKGLLVWQSNETFEDWRSAMKCLAEVKIAFRTHQDLAFTTGHGPFADRHLLAYPVTNHSVKNWGNQSRLANQLRFKVLEEGDAFRSIAFHLPCALPRELADKLGRPAPSQDQQASIWRNVHKVLDQQMQRIP